MLLAKRPRDQESLTTLRKTRRVLKAEADPAMMLQQFSSIRGSIGNNVKERIKDCLLEGERIGQEFYRINGTLKSWILFEMSIEEVASLVPTQKAEKIFRKWFGGPTQREKEIGYEVIDQMCKLDYQGLLVNYPSCLYRFSGMEFVNETLDADFTLTDAKELCHHWTPLQPSDSRYHLNITTKEMTRTAHRLLDAFQHCQKPGRISFIFDRRL